MAKSRCIFLFNNQELTCFNKSIKRSKKILLIIMVYLIGNLIFVLNTAFFLNNNFSNISPDSSLCSMRIRDMYLYFCPSLFSVFQHGSERETRETKVETYLQTGASYSQPYRTKIINNQEDNPNLSEVLEFRW